MSHIFDDEVQVHRDLLALINSPEPVFFGGSFPVPAHVSVQTVGDVARSRQLSEGLGNPLDEPRHAFGHKTYEIEFPTDPRLGTATEVFIREGEELIARMLAGGGFHPVFPQGSCDHLRPE